MIDRPFKPGERVAALVNGEHTHLVFSPIEFVKLKGNAPDPTTLMK